MSTEQVFIFTPKAPKVLSSRKIFARREKLLTARARLQVHCAIDKIAWFKERFAKYMIAMIQWKKQFFMTPNFGERKKKVPPKPY